LSSLQYAYHRDDILTLANPVYRDFVQQYLSLMLRADIGESGDLTSGQLTDNTTTGTARIIARQQGIVAGIPEVNLFCQTNGIVVERAVEDRAVCVSGTELLTLRGELTTLLAIERTLLNLLQRMCGIATLTRQLADLAAPTLISATRKTPLGYLDKRAVLLGGGGTHRLGLWDAVLIKDNHLAAVDKQSAIHDTLQIAWENRDKSRFIEIEVGNEQEALTAAKVMQQLAKLDTNYPLILMLDNFDPEAIQHTLARLATEGLRQHLLIELSGGVDQNNLKQYTHLGADVISLGALTHSAPALDISLQIKRSNQA